MLSLLRPYYSLVEMAANGNHQVIIQVISNFKVEIKIII